MSEMVKRVAEATRRRAAEFRRENSDYRGFSEAVARAAIAAMCELTEAERLAMNKAYRDAGPDRDAVEYFHAMIDEALK